MNERDWDFALGELGNPLADIEHWMTPPYPKCMVEEINNKERGTNDQPSKSTIIS